MEESLKRTLKGLKENESTISMFLGGLVVIVVGVLLYNYFKSPTPQVTDESAATVADEYTLQISDQTDGNRIPTGLPLKHTVVPGENLWSIAEKYYGSGYNWVDIVAVNQIRDGNQLYAGSDLTIPQVRVRVPLNRAEVTEKQNEHVQVTSISDDTYVVKKGDSLWTVAVRAYGDGYQWTKIFEANRQVIDSPGSIDVGWELVIPR